MKTKRIFVAVLLLAIIGGGVASYMMFGFYSVKASDGSESHIFVRKTSSFDVGDVVAYRYPMEFDTKLSSRDVYVSRIIGIPGDIIAIDDGILYKNNKEVEADYVTYYRYRASVDSISVDFNAILSNYDVRIGDILNGGKACEFVCTEAEFEKIKKGLPVKDVHKSSLVIGIEYYDENNNIIWGNICQYHIIIPQNIPKCMYSG